MHKVYIKKNSHKSPLPARRCRGTKTHLTDQTEGQCALRVVQSTSNDQLRRTRLKNVDEQPSTKALFTRNKASKSKFNRANAFIPPLLFKGLMTR